MFRAEAKYIELLCGRGLGQVFDRVAKTRQTEANQKVKVEEKTKLGGPTGK